MDNNVHPRGGHLAIPFARHSENRGTSLDTRSLATRHALLLSLSLLEGDNTSLFFFLDCVDTTPHSFAYVKAPTRGDFETR